jgi:hypothetical protein
MFLEVPDEFSLESASMITLDCVADSTIPLAKIVLLYISKVVVFAPLSVMPTMQERAALVEQRIVEFLITIEFTVEKLKSAVNLISLSLTVQVPFTVLLVSHKLDPVY